MRHSMNREVVPVANRPSLALTPPPHPNTIGSRSPAEKKCFSGNRYRCAYLTSEAIEMLGHVLFLLRSNLPNHLFRLWYGEPAESITEVVDWVVIADQNHAGSIGFESKIGYHPFLFGIHVGRN
jgi:hypothetical protein